MIHSVPTWSADERKTPSASTLKRRRLVSEAAPLIEQTVAATPPLLDSGSHACPRCKRIFIMPDGLARHLQRKTSSCTLEMIRLQRAAEALKSEPAPKKARTETSAPKTLVFGHQSMMRPGAELLYQPPVATAPRPATSSQPPPTSSVIDESDGSSGLDAIVEVARDELSREALASPVVGIQKSAPTVVPGANEQRMTSQSSTTNELQSTATVADAHALPPPTTTTNSSTSTTTAEPAIQITRPDGEVARLYNEIQTLKAEIGAEYKRREMYDRESKRLLQTKMLQLANLEVMAWERAEKK